MNFKPSCGSSKSLLHNLGLENSTCVAAMCFHVRNLDGSVVSDCGVTRHVLGVGDTPANALLLVGMFSVGNPTCPHAFGTFSTKH